MRYTPIDEETVQEIIDGIHPRKSVDDITNDLSTWSNFMTTIIEYIGALINALKDFMGGN